jgi:two-component system phosphate regulon sensor histidine kinase PhoR
LRRDDERNQAELTEWLARFRQAMHLLPDGVAIMDDVCSSNGATRRPSATWA